MVNAHPVILFQLMKKNKPDDDCYWLRLKQYHINREVKLKEVQEVHGVSRGSAKQLFICLINNSSYDSWKKREFLECPCTCGSGKNTKSCCNKYNENDEKLGSNAKIPFVEDFAKEIKNVTRILKQHNQEMYNEIAEKKKKQKKTFHDGSFMSILLGTYERILLEEAVKYFESREFILNNNIVGAFDGMMSVREHIGDLDTSDICKEIQTHLKSQTGFDIEWSTKPFDSFYSDEELKPFEFEYTNVWNNTYMNSLSTYARKKQYFELFFVKIEKPEVRFVRSDK